MSNTGYFHVLLTYEGKDEEFGIRDLSEVDLKDKFVKPYNRGDTFLVGNKVTAPDKVTAVRILVSSEHSKVLLEREQQRRVAADDVINRTDPGFFILRAHTMGSEDLAGLSVDVTQRYIKRLPGSRPGPASGFFNHPWMLAVVAAAVSGLIVAFLAKTLGLT